MQEYIKLGRGSEGKSFRAEAMGEGSMSKRSLALRVGGAAGDGVSSTAESFAKMSARSGLHTWTYSSYQSVIRGGHRLSQVPRGLWPPPVRPGRSIGSPGPDRETQRRDP